MAISLKHNFVSTKSDGPNATLIRPSDWNAEHAITQATARILGRVTAGEGATEELTADQMRAFLNVAQKDAAPPVRTTTDASTTVLLADANGIIQTNHGSPNTVEVPSVLFVPGVTVRIVQIGAGQTTITPGIGATVRSAGGALKISARYGVAWIHCWSIAPFEWVAYGDLTT